jgi:hypothetical protein
MSLLRAFLCGEGPCCALAARLSGIPSVGSAAADGRLGLAKDQAKKEVEKFFGCWSARKSARKGSNSRPPHPAAASTARLVQMHYVT